jgi:hypothetical protein
VTRLARIGLLASLALAGCATARPGHATLAPFRTDGCSLFPDGSIENPDQWCDCCLRHDLAYWQGGAAGDRLAADRDLRECVRERTGDPGLAGMVFAGVRAGGAAVFPTWFRWGYGWPYGRGNQPLTPDERAQADELRLAYLRRNPDLRCAVDRKLRPARTP